MLTKEVSGIRQRPRTGGQTFLDVEEELLDEMVEVAAYFEMDGLVHAIYEHLDASDRK